MVIVTCGRPCGPCYSRKRCLHLKTATMLVGISEFFLGCAVLAGSIGSVSATALNHNTLKAAYTKEEFNGMYISYSWHAGCSIILIPSSIFTLIGYLKWSHRWLIAYIIGVVTGHLAHLGGLYFSFEVAPVYSAIILLTPLRAYFVWIVFAFALQIRMYPEGYPPPQKEFKKPAYELPAPPATAETSLRIVGDG